MIKKTLLTLLICLLFFSAGEAQTTKKRLTIDDVVAWNRITEQEISNDGALIAVKLEPWKGSTVVKLYNNRGKELFSADSSGSVSFDENGNYLIFKRGDNKKGSLNIYSIKDGSVRVIPDVINYKLPKGWDGYIAYQTKDSAVVVEKFDQKEKISLEKVSGYALSESNGVAVFASGTNLILHHPGATASDTIWRGEKPISTLAVSDDGSKVSFVSAEKLFVIENRAEAKNIASGVSARRAPNFSPDGSRLYYGIAMEKRERDTSYTKEDYPEVHIWHWQENRQFTQQVVEKRRDMARSDLAVYTFEKGSSFQVSNQHISETRLIDKGNSQIVIGLSNENYQLQQMWEGRFRYDIYVIDTYLERLSLIAQGVQGQVRVSPAGKYIYWYSSPDSAWYACSVAAKDIIQITNPAVIASYNEDNDVPDWPSSYQSAGWTNGDERFLVYDKFDIWSIDPKGVEAPVNLTVNGRESGITYRYINTEKESEFIDISGKRLLIGFDNNTKGYGYYAFESGKKRAPMALMSGSYMLSVPEKATDANIYMFTKQSFTEFPDILISDASFKKITRITDANPQQKDFIWGTAELITWTSYEGDRLQGVIYKPENFDSAKKYPMIVNFYERNSSSLHSYRTPEPHRSTIDYHMYNSNDYVIFNPDIVYKEGYPGESAFNAVMPGISTVLSMGFVDPERIGAQGHSWGGYQVAYMATRTNLFAAIESGAPVVNMYSAYGGIRWETGRNRSFQYEHQQSRIAKTPWESPLRYIENSPIFTMDKVNTPILIMHNDQDGHVPWYQGIEYFVALKRLQKPVWMLNYTGEVHWPQKMKNKIDFQIRMMQFFDHYLKGEPMPKWMREPLSVIDLDYELGY